MKKIIDILNRRRFAFLDFIKKGKIFIIRITQIIIII